ncbi:MAG: aquaporin Z [Hyphomicrobiaceae bacterium]
MSTKPLAAEFIGTFALVSATCGSALFSAPSGGGLVAVAMAIGLSVLMMAYAVGHISGGHFNPAVTLGLVAGGRFDAAKAPGYIVAQVLGGIAAAAIFSVILNGYLGNGRAEFNTFAAISNNFGEPGGFSALAVFLTEIVVTGLFVIVIMGATSPGAPAGFAPLAIGVALMVLHLASIPVTNASLNPARSTAPALFAGGTALANLWMFWLAPILGGILGGLISRWLQDE